MPRAKGGFKSRRRHKRQLKLASGYVGGRKLYRQAMQASVGDMGEYRYPHDYPGGWVEQQYLPPGMEPPGWYRPKKIGYERAVRARFARLGQEEDDSA